MSDIQKDIELVVGGSFSPDHIGPEAHQQLQNRIHAAPKRYLQTFVKMFLGTNAAQKGDGTVPYFATFLELIAKDLPQDANHVATRLIAQLNSQRSALDPQKQGPLAELLKTRIEELQAL